MLRRSAPWVVHAAVLGSLSVPFVRCLRSCYEENVPTPGWIDLDYRRFFAGLTVTVAILFVVASSVFVGRIRRRLVVRLLLAYVAAVGIVFAATLLVVLFDVKLDRLVPAPP